MVVIHSDVFTVIKKFPEHRETIRRLSKSDDNFVTLCEDYRKCQEALVHWMRLKSEQASIRSSEYISLLHELENEILQSLGAVTKRNL